jgi:hypothetical protein
VRRLARSLICLRFAVGRAGIGSLGIVQMPLLQNKLRRRRLIREHAHARMYGIRSLADPPRFKLHSIRR